MPASNIFNGDPLMSSGFTVKLEFSKPRHLSYDLPGMKPEELAECIIAVDGEDIYLNVNKSTTGDDSVPVLEVLKDLFENQVYINVILRLQDRSGNILWTKESQGRTIGDFGFSSDYRSTGCLITRVRLVESSYSQTVHKSDKSNKI
jgi:hypothetical protein